MLKFHEENHNIFDFFIKVEKENDSYNVKALFPENAEIPDVLKNIGLFCFPYDHMTFDKEYQFYFCLTDSSKKQTFIYVNRKKTTAFCLSTPFFHPHFFLEISYILSGIYESSISRACAKYLESKIYHDKVDWRASWNIIPKNEHEVSNYDQYCNKISPPCELSKLYQYIFTKLPIQYILITIVAMTLDCRIIVTSSELSDISVAIFSLLALIYPLNWPGTFIPILPSAILTMLDAPFAYLIGIHSSSSDAMLSIDRYFIVNVDFHYCASIGMEDFPPEVLKYIDERSDSLKKLINRCAPIFPFVQIQKQIRMFIRDLFGVAYNLDKTDDFQKIVNSYNKWKSMPSEEFKAIFSQTQFINSFINSITYDQNQEIFHAFWPNHVFIQANPPTTDDTTEIPKHCGLKRCRKNSIGKQDVEKLLHSSNQSFFDLNDNSSNDNADEISKEKDDSNNSITMTNNPENKNDEDQHENSTKESDEFKAHNEHHDTSHTNKRKVNSIHLASIDLKLDFSSLDKNDDELFEGHHRSRKTKRKRSSKHRSQSVENKVIYRNNSYSVLNQRISKEEPPPTSMKNEFPEYFDKTNESYIKNANDQVFLQADDDMNLTPAARKMPPHLPIPKKPLSKPTDNMSISCNNGSRSSRGGIRRVGTFDYLNSPKEDVVPSSSRISKNSSHSKISIRESRTSGQTNPNSSNVIHSSVNCEINNKDNNKDNNTTHRRKKKRSQSNLIDNEDISINNENRTKDQFTRNISSKHRSQSVENNLIPKNISYSVLHHRISKEEPLLNTSKSKFPEYFDDKDFIQAEDDQNLSPLPRKMPHNLPIPKRPLSKPPDPPRPNINTNNNNNDSLQRNHKSKSETFDYSNTPKGSILISSSQSLKNVNERKMHNNEIKRVEITKRSSSTALQSSSKSNEDDHTRKRRKKRTQSSETDKNKGLQYHKDDKTGKFEILIDESSISNDTSKNANREAESENAIEIKHRNRNNNADKYKSKSDNDEEKSTDKSNLEIEIEIETETEPKITKKPIRKPASPINRSARLRPIPGSLNNKNRVPSLQLRPTRPIGPLTPRNRPNIRNSAQYSDIKKKEKLTDRDLSPSQKFASNPFLVRNRPKVILEISDNYSDYDYNYSEYEDQPIKINTSKTINNNSNSSTPTATNSALSARIDSNNVHKNNFIIHHLPKKRKASFETPKTGSIQQTKVKSNGNTSDNNGNSNTNNSPRTILRVAPNIRRNIPSKQFNNQQKTTALIKFSSSSDSYESA